MGHEKKVERHSVYGIFNDHYALDRAVNILKSHNFRSSDISILMQPNEITKNFGFEKHTKAPEGATTGAATGAVAGVVFGWLVGAGALAIPGLGPFIAAGPIMAAIAGAGLGGTVGGIAGGLIGLGISESDAQIYEGYVKEGGMLISIHVDDAIWEAKAREILEESGALNIATTSEKKSSDDTSYVQTNIDQDFDNRGTSSHT